AIIDEDYPEEDVDFEYGGAYSIYNWELFFHAPVMIADRLSKNQRFEEAQKWFHYVFDPTDTSSYDVPIRYWQTKPFCRSEEPEEFENCVLEWRKNPFKPHLIARMRPITYQKTVVMKYIDNLIAWGDQLFRRDSIESINEATQLYILASEILGRRPEDIPRRALPKAQTYNTLERSLGNVFDAVVQVEEFLPPYAELIIQPKDKPRLTLPTMLYFCLPKNDHLLEYWDTVADRLFKIRHCMNIEGLVRLLPMFEPPIEPSLLVKATAAGIDISSAINDLNAALPQYRFSIMVQKAVELCAELKSLSGALLAALEKRDAEELALIRAGHERSLLELVESVKRQQYDEAKQNVVALKKSRDLATSRYLHYQKLLGVDDPQIPDEGQPIPDHPASEHISIQEEEGVKILEHEKEELDNLKKASDKQYWAGECELGASISHVLPTLSFPLPWAPKSTLSFGGSNIGSGAQAFANRRHREAGEASYNANRASKLAQFVLREHDWALQSNLAAKEIMHVDQQIIAAEIREKIAEQELKNHRKQIDNALEVEEFMQSKYTNRELYSWMVGQVSAIYFQSYQLAYDVAKRAERAYRFELGLKDSNFIQFGYWDNLKKGLLAGERLHHDLKRMEVAYLEKNKREYEITKHVPLSEIDPLALARLKQTGECFVSLPEALFDLDYPGHYLRRIKSVGLTIPCVSGPYTGVHCTLTLLNSSIRHKNTLLGDRYSRQEEDPRFTDSIGAIQSIVTSSGQNDSGLFEVNLRDERYLPFEGAGAISDWHIELPKDFRQFDYDTISDVVLHLRYTAREAGGQLKQKANGELQEALNEFIRSEGQNGLARIFSLRHEFPSEWHSFLNPPEESEGDQTLTMDLSKKRFPFLFQEKKITFDVMELFVKVKLE
ncbi:MAG: hypothetical protein GKC09_12435, partial [Methanosarcinales archaeon]|nr:hypothetical protein [Methanosarcinales archaeon]